MAEEDRTARNLSTAYVLSFFIQLAAVIAAAVGMAVWASPGSSRWGLWLWLSGVFCFVGCHVLQWYVKCWFRRRWPME